MASRISTPGIIACPGGTLFEIAAHQGRVKDYLTWLHQIGVRHVEVSNGALGMPTEAKQRYIREFADEGFIVLSEVGSKDPSQTVVGSEWADEMLADLGNGATLVIAEGRESGTVGLYDGAGQPDQRLVGELTERVPVDLVHLAGSVELAAVSGLTDAIVDLVESGRTLEENGLVVVDELLQVSARLVVNRAAYRLKVEELLPLLEKLG